MIGSFVTEVLCGESGMCTHYPSTSVSNDRLQEEPATKGDVQTVVGLLAWGKEDIIQEVVQRAAIEDARKRRTNDFSRRAAVLGRKGPGIRIHEKRRVVTVREAQVCRV